jgi:hypothetical protein
MDAFSFALTGGWVWQLGALRDEHGKKLAPDYDAIADFCVRHHIEWLGLKCGERSFTVNTGNWRRFATALNAKGVHLVSWHYGLDPRKLVAGVTWNEEVQGIVRMRDVGVSAHILNFEVPWCFNGSAPHAEAYCDELETYVPGLPIAHAPMAVWKYHPSYPWDVLNARLAATLPQLYATEVGRGSWTEMRDVYEPVWAERKAKYPNEAPVYPIANTYGKDTAAWLSKCPGTFDPQAFDEQLGRYVAAGGYSVYSLEAADKRALQVMRDRVKVVPRGEGELPDAVNVTGTNPRSRKKRDADIA